MAAVLFADCGQSQPPIGAPGARQQTSATTTLTDRGNSFIQAPRYVYVTNLARSDSGAAPSVTVYSAAGSGNVPPSEVIAVCRPDVPV
jgi:hypothetical protein